MTRVRGRRARFPGLPPRFPGLPPRRPFPFFREESDENPIEDVLDGAKTSASCGVWRLA